MDLIADRSGDLHHNGRVGGERRHLARGWRRVEFPSSIGHADEQMRERRASHGRRDGKVYRRVMPGTFGPLLEALTCFGR